jgi:hypothetical protein
MTIRLLLALARDQRRVLALGVVLALAAGLGPILATPREFEAKAILVVSAPSLLPAEPERPLEGVQVTNPLVRNDGSLSDVARLLVADATASPISSDSPVQVSGGTAPTFLPATSPFISVSAKGTDPAALDRMVREEVDHLRDQLRRLQVAVGVQPGTDMTLQTVAAVAVAPVGLLTSSRSALIVALAVLALAVLVAFARADGLRLGVPNVSPHNPPDERRRS